MIRLLYFGVVFTSMAYAQQGMIKTGTGVRSKKIALLTFDVYRAEHYIQELPKVKKGLKAYVLNAKVDKLFKLEFLRDVETKLLKDSLQETYRVCGFRDKKKIAEMLGVFKKDFKKGDRVEISYKASESKLSFAIPGGASVTSQDPQLALATWCIWFGKGLAKEQPRLGDQLLELVK